MNPTTAEKIKAARAAAKDARRRLYGAILALDTLTRGISERLNGATPAERHTIADEVEAVIDQYVEAANKLPGRHGAA